MLETVPCNRSILHPFLSSSVWYIVVGNVNDHLHSVSIVYLFLNSWPPSFESVVVGFVVVNAVVVTMTTGAVVVVVYYTVNVINVG